MHNISLELSKVNFNKVDDVVGFGALIMSYANQCGLISGNTSSQSREVIQLTETARRWVNTIKIKMRDYSPSQMFQIGGIFDLVHRIGFRQPADQVFLDNILFDALNARIHGDKSIDAYQLYYAIDFQLKRKNRAVLDKPLRWLSDMFDRWYRNVKTGKINDMSDYDIIRQSGILIGADLFMYEGTDDNFQKRLFDNCKHYLDNIKGMSLSELEALSKFLIAAIKFMPNEDYWKYDEEIMDALIENKDINRYYRESLEINVAMMAS